MIARLPPASMLRRVRALLFACLAIFAGCKQPYCDFAAECVETCDGPFFRHCGPCPEGSYEVELCDPRPESCSVAPPRPATDECGGDADCAAGEACACNTGPDGAHVCIPAACVGPDDCEQRPCLATPAGYVCAE